MNMLNLCLIARGPAVVSELPEAASISIIFRRWHLVVLLSPSAINDNSCGGSSKSFNEK